MGKLRPEAVKSLGPQRGQGKAGAQVSPISLCPHCLSAGQGGLVGAVVWCVALGPGEGLEMQSWGPQWLSPPSTVGEDDGSCEVNGQRFRDGDTFQPHCSVHCRCEGGGFTCLPLCAEDVRLPSWDCPQPRRVAVPGRCCPEWVCNQGWELRAQHLPAQGECRTTKATATGVGWAGFPEAPGHRDTTRGPWRRKVQKAESLDPLKLTKQGAVATIYNFKPQIINKIWW
jgi:hypothetical protein